MAASHAEKKLKLFNLLKDGCNSEITQLYESHAEFENLREDATVVHKEDLSYSLRKVEEKFDKLEAQFHSIILTISDEQTTACKDFIDEIKNKINLLKKAIKTSLVEFEKRLATSKNTPTQPKKTNVDFAPEKLTSETEFIPYMQWRFDFYGLYNQNRFFLESFEIQRRHLEKYLDDTLRAILANKAPKMDEYPVVPEFQTYSGVPEFPVETPCCFNLLDDYFDKKHPQMMRLWSYTQLYQAGQFENEKV